jgi:Na+-driven multidrug efflux pump
LVWILAPGAVFLACGQVVGDLLRGKNLPLIVAKAQGLAAILTVILLLALLPMAGVAGAAIASTIAYGTALVIMLRALTANSRHRSRHSIGAKRRSRAHRIGLWHTLPGRHRCRTLENLERQPH